MNLGTKKHKDKYSEKIDSLEYPGCFAMTELHHGNLFHLYILLAKYNNFFSFILAAKFRKIASLNIYIYVTGDIQALC